MAHAFDYASHGSGPSFALAPVDFDHPVFDALDGRTQALLWGAGQRQTYTAGETLETTGQVIFVEEGIVGHIPPQLSVCVSVSGAGSVFGLESAVTQTRLTPAIALARTRVLQAPAETLVEGLGRTRLQELCIRHTQARMSEMEGEAACNAAHLVPQRLAKWILRLHLANRRRDVCLTQADLAGLLGVQRSTVNVAIRQLQVVGAIRFVRGRIIVICSERLGQSACACAH